MQSLVYDNYNKFISATDTIRKMKTQVETMESDMKRLEDNMLSIGELSAHVMGGKGGGERGEAGRGGGGSGGGGRGAGE